MEENYSEISNPGGGRTSNERFPMALLA